MRCRLAAAIAANAPGVPHRPNTPAPLPALLEVGAVGGVLDLAGGVPFAAGEGVAVAPPAAGRRAALGLAAGGGEATAVALRRRLLGPAGEPALVAAAGLVMLASPKALGEGAASAAAAAAARCFVGGGDLSCGCFVGGGGDGSGLEGWGFPWSRQTSMLAADARLLRAAAVDAGMGR